ncbi:MAG: hypothetical protein IT532_05135 [Burkholderiales bacterium]|nr:hypothetical protein [Burkholderiales bacterium]
MARERLFSLIDAGRAQRNALCIVGPPGAGKTTLVASWADLRKVPGIWYQVDAGDADLATLFLYLGEAATPFIRKGARRLPALTSEYLQDIPGFARRFFRDLFELLPSSACVILDNTQEAPAASPFHRIIADAVAEVPAGQCLIAISRRDPPDCYARLIANDHVAFIDWDALRLTLAETTAIVSARASLPAGEVERLHAASGGWAAGLTLMLEGRRRTEARPHEPPTERALLFGYFASQIFEQVPAPTRRFLMLTALLPQVPAALARELTGEAQASEILEDLYQRHLFTHRRNVAEATYWYHALFRDYLLTQATLHFTAQALREHERRAARLLDAAGSFDEAFELFRHAEDWDATARLVGRRAEAMLAHGRGQTLRDWLDALPPERVSHTAWLRYWRGTSLIAADQVQARSELEAAYAMFSSDGDREGQAMSAAGVLDTYHFEWASFGPMADWVARLEPLIDRGILAGKRERELKLYASMLTGIYYAVPDHPKLQQCLARVTEMLDESTDANTKLQIASFLLAYCNLAGDLERGKLILSRCAGSIDSPHVTPLNAFWWTMRSGHLHFHLGELRAARQLFDRARAILVEYGLTGVRSGALLLNHYELLLECNLGHHEAAARLIRQTEALARSTRPMDTFHVVHAQTQLAFLTQDVDALRRWGDAACRAAQPVGMPYLTVQALLYQVHAFAALGEADRLHDTVAEVRAIIDGTCLAYFECELRFVLAYHALVHGPGLHTAAQARDAVRYACEQDYHYPFTNRYGFATTAVLAACLPCAGNATQLHEVIRRLHIRPPSLHVAHWPWPIRIECLGRFAMELDGVPLTFPGKQPRKPLALLEAIIALGGTDVPQGVLVDALWPDEDGDAGRQTLGVTLVRLRKLLGQHEAIVVADDRIGMNWSICWCDAHSFEAEIAHALRARKDADAHLSMLEQCAALYRGGFLPGDSDASWSMQARLRLRGQFVAAIEEIGQAHERREHWQSAIEHYRRGVAADDLVEEFYVGQMRCYAALNRPAEALAVFRRLRQTLSVVLGIQPSAAAHSLACRLAQRSAIHDR